MDQSNIRTGFYESLPRLTSFDALTDPSSYVPLPDDWVIGCSDIVGSTAQIAAGRYKTVNMVGAAVISSQINASNGQVFPYVFGGDGATFACAPDMAETSARMLAVTQRWAGEEFDLSLRTALVPVSDIRAAGLDVAVARFQASPGVDYGMFSGGGLSWSEAQMKAGAFTIPAAPKGVIPDLTGLSCRWSNVQAQNGKILSVVVNPTETCTQAQFAQVAQAIVETAGKLNRGGHPVPVKGPGVRWPPPGLTLEAHMSRGVGSLTKRKLELLYHSLIAWAFFKTGIKAGAFDPTHYAETLSRNADFRKFDDGLKMTLDCDAGTRNQIETLLTQARSGGLVQFGLFEQDEAMVTCFVPSITQDDHVHLIDGASGGYTQAAAQIKSTAI